MKDTTSPESPEIPTDVAPPVVAAAVVPESAAADANESSAEGTALILATSLGDITETSIVKVVSTERSIGEAKKKVKDHKFLEGVAKAHFGSDGYALYVIPQKSQRKIQCVLSFRAVD